MGRSPPLAGHLRCGVRKQHQKNSYCNERVTSHSQHNALALRRTRLCAYRPHPPPLLFLQYTTLFSFVLKHPSLSSINKYSLPTHHNLPCLLSFQLSKQPQQQNGHGQPRETCPFHHKKKCRVLLFIRRLPRASLAHPPPSILHRCLFPSASPLRYPPLSTPASIF